MIYIADVLRKGLKDSIKSYDALSPEAKVKARAEIIEQEVLGINRRIEMVKDMSINAVVNDKNKIPAIIRSINHTKKITQNDAYCYQFIIQNFSEFLPDGTYISYAKEGVY
jgi:hypothetical protein